ncbi:MAG: inositol monophosphatase family protein [Actinomycetota bacterium]
MDPEARALALARRIRDRVRPLMGTPQARRRTGTAHGGDPTYGIDAAAEAVVAEVFDKVDAAAYFTEGEGLVVRGDPEVLFLIDPVDGTRPAAAGYETSCVTVAVAPFDLQATLGDVTYGCVVELTTEATFEARRGSGVEVRGRALAPTGTTDLGDVFWAGGFRGLPAVPVATVLSGLFDAPGTGTYFDQGSAAYSLTRVATGQLDAYVDPGQAIVDTVPGMEAAFRRVGGGHVLNTTTYDTAAGVLLLWELGLPVTDALGADLRPVPLLGPDGRASLLSTVAASTPELHAEILGVVAEGLERLRRG